MSRPSKSALAFLPLYLADPSTPYCHTCGRVVSTEKQGPSRNVANRRASKRGPTQPQAKPVPKYCSDRCRRSKPTRLDREIESLFVTLLEGHRGIGEDTNREEEQRGQVSGVEVLKKGDSRQLQCHVSESEGNRNIIMCSVVENLVFGPRREAEDLIEGDHEKAETANYGSSSKDDSENNTQQVGIGNSAVEEPQVESEEEIETESLRPSENRNKLGGSIDWDKLIGPQGVSIKLESRDGALLQPGEPDDKQKGRSDTDNHERRARGQQRAEEREMVRRAARRGVVFGFIVDGEGGPGEDQPGGNSKKHSKVKDSEGAAEETKDRRRKCEIVADGVILEPSFAKGDWGIRWRE